MADSGSSIPGELFKDVPKRGQKISMPILSFLLKWMDTCCQLLKTVKFRPKAIENPTEGNVDIVVDSKAEGEWSVKYLALDYKVGSSSDGTDTLSYNGTEKSVTRFFSDLMNKLIDTVKYQPLDCDTMHTIDDIHVIEHSIDESENTDNVSETKQDVDDLKEETNDHHEERKQVDKEVKTSRDIRDAKTEARDTEAWDEIYEVTIYKRVVTGQLQNEEAAKENKDDNVGQGTRRAADSNSKLNEDKVDDKADATSGKGNSGEGNKDDNARRGTRRAADGNSKLNEDKVDGKADATSGKGNSEEVEAARGTKWLKKKIQIWLTLATYWPMCKYERESKASKLHVFAETSTNPGYCRLKLNKYQPMTKSQKQILFLFESDDDRDYLKKPKPIIFKDLATSYVKTYNLKPDVAIMVNEPKYKILSFLSCKGQMGNQDNIETKDTFFAVGLDWVLCLKMPQWPKMAQEWITRDRKSNWPSCELVVEVVLAGCHVVPKSHSDNREDVTEWRISFSEAERILFMQLSEPQKACFRMFKMVTQLHCKVIVNEKEEYPSSYALKTIFLWECEEIAPTTWEQNPGSCFLGLLEKLAEALENVTIKGYFVPEMNLIGHTDPKLIREYLGVVREILQDPIKILAETWKVIIEPKLGWTFDRTFGELIRSADSNDESQDIAQARCCLNLALMTNDYICQGAVTRNSFMTKITQQVYGCQGPSTTDMKMIGNEVDKNVHVTEADNSGLHAVEKLLEDCYHFSRKYAANPLVRFGIHAQVFILFGEVDYMQGRVQEAKNHFERAIKILTTKGCKVAPRSMSRVYTQYAKCLAALQFPIALQEYDTALELDPDNKEAQVYRVMFLDRKGKKEDVERIIKDVIGGHDILKTGRTRGVTMIQMSRGDLMLLDEVLCSEVKALLDWTENFPRFPYRTTSEAVPKVFLPDTLIFSHLYMKGQKITKATLNNELRPWVNLIADAGKTGRADCQYIANSLLGMMNYNAENYWEALKLLHSLAKTGHCSERVNAHMDLLKTLLKITIQ